MDEKALHYATRRIEDFISVQRHNEEKLAAIELLFGSLGLEKDVRESLDLWLTKLGVDDPGEVMLGLLVGLFIQQYNEESAEP